MKLSCIRLISALPIILKVVIPGSDSASNSYSKRGVRANHNYAEVHVPAYLGDPCNKNEDCYIKNSFCQGNKNVWWSGQAFCTCKAGFEPRAGDCVVRNITVDGLGDEKLFNDATKADTATSTTLGPTGEQLPIDEEDGGMRYPLENTADLLPQETSTDPMERTKALLHVMLSRVAALRGAAEAEPPERDPGEDSEPPPPPPPTVKPRIRTSLVATTQEMPITFATRPYTATLAPVIPTGPDATIPPWMIWVSQDNLKAQSGPLRPPAYPSPAPNAVASQVVPMPAIPNYNNYNYPQQAQVQNTQPATAPIPQPQGFHYPFYATSRPQIAAPLISATGELLRQQQIYRQGEYLKQQEQIRAQEVSRQQELLSILRERLLLEAAAKVGQVAQLSTALPTTSVPVTSRPTTQATTTTTTSSTTTSPSTTSTTTPTTTTQTSTSTTTTTASVQTTRRFRPMRRTTTPDLVKHVAHLRQTLRSGRLNKPDRWSLESNSYSDYEDEFEPEMEPTTMRMPPPGVAIRYPKLERSDLGYSELFPEESTRFTFGGDSATSGPQSDNSLMKIPALESMMNNIDIATILRQAAEKVMREYMHNWVSSQQAPSPPNPLFDMHMQNRYHSQAQSHDGHQLVWIVTTTQPSVEITTTTRRALFDLVRRPTAKILINGKRR